jgi:PAS domain S-box-containing protein
MKHSHFKARTFALFFAASLVPALIMAVAWYGSSQLDNGGLDTTIVIVLMVFGLSAAVILSFIFATLLTRPVKRIHSAALQLAGQRPAGTHEIAQPKGELAQTIAALKRASEQLEEKMSETSSEMALIEAERNKLRSVLNTMTDGVFAIDRDGRIILFNRAAGELTGRSMEAVAGQLAEKVMPFRQDGKLIMTSWLTSPGAKDKHGQWRGLELFRADGTSLFVDVQAVMLSNDPNGIRALITFHDLTEEHKLEEMKVDFVALAAHELRTPITEIRGYLDIMQHEPIGLKPAGRELVDHAAGSVAQLSGLINNILGVSRIEHGEMSYQPEPTDWHDFIEQLEPELNLRAKQNNRKLSFKIGKNLPKVMIDPIAMKEVILNLVGNAINHTEAKNGKIEVSAELVDHEIETSVVDNGTGIPAAAVSHLFTKFFRYEGLKSTRGTGLGLYICKAIIEEHGGYIWVETKEGKGSNFSFRLPTKTKLAGQRPTRDTSKVTRGIHGWIKNSSLRRG